MQVIERDGVAGVTQRSVARQADLPPSAVMYYFPTIDDLLVAALTACNDSYLRRLTELAGDPRALEHLAELITDGAGPRRAQVTAEYELFLLAARRPDLRDELARWIEALDAFLARYLEDPVDRGAAAAAVDGLFLRCLCVDPPPGTDEILTILRRLVRG